MGSAAGYLPFLKSFETICIHHAQEPTQWKSQTVVPPIVTSTIFKIDDPTKPGQFLYSRMQNPSRFVMENVMAGINNAKHGFCFSSGISVLTGLLGTMKKGDHIVACDEINGERDQVFRVTAKNLGICTTFADFSNLESLSSAIQENTKLFWVENPTEATLKVADLCAVSKIAKSKNILFAVDNSLLTPYLQRPLEFGADIACQSVTKYINGHSDVSMGCITINRDDIQQNMKLSQVVLGLVPSPFDCYQALRGLKTIHIRMEQHYKNAITIATYLEQNSAVEKVLYPGLKSHPHHELMKKQTSGCSGILSFYLKGDSKDVEKFVKNLNYFTLSETTGGIESTISVPMIMSHKTVHEQTKQKLCIKNNLLRISVGLENICDLILDLDAAFSCLKSK